MFAELRSEQRRQMIDSQQVFEVWREADRERRRRFLGSMRWVERSGSSYLLRKIGKTETSLGPKIADTEAAHAAFIDGRARNKERLVTLAQRLDQLAPVNRAMGLGRVPRTAARILRKIDEKELLGNPLMVVGTNALFAYEAVAGVRIDSGVVASQDIDLLFDTRRRLTVAVSKGLGHAGLIGVLRQADKSFDVLQPRGYRAANADGYLVDFIRPLARNVFHDDGKSAFTDHADDLESVSIEGLSWLIDAPKLEVIVLDDRGYPVLMIVPDPRVFALHKAWLGARADREPIKARRDQMQARVVAMLASRYLGLTWDAGEELAALPTQLRDLIPDLRDGAQGQDSGAPAW